MNRIFIATLGFGTILNAAAASAQGYPFPPDSTDQPWSVNQRPSAQQPGLAKTTSQPSTVNREPTPHPSRDGASQLHISLVALGQSGQVAR